MLLTQGFVVGDTGDVHLNGTKRGRSTVDGGIPMTSNINADDDAEAVADDVKMLHGQRSDAAEGDDAAVPAATASAPVDAAAAEVPFQSIPFALQARSPKFYLLLLLFATSGDVVFQCCC